MKDIFGNELAIGDVVAFNMPRYKGLSIGKIIKFTPKGVRVSYIYQNDPCDTALSNRDVVKKNSLVVHITNNQSTKFYRLLNAGEVVQAGDEMWDIRWHEIKADGLMIGYIVTNNGYPFRRLFV